MNKPAQAGLFRFNLPQAWYTAVPRSHDFAADELSDYWSQERFLSAGWDAQRIETAENACNTANMSYFRRTRKIQVATFRLFQISSGLVCRQVIQRIQQHTSSDRFS